MSLKRPTVGPAKEEPVSEAGAPPPPGRPVRGAGILLFVLVAALISLAAVDVVADTTLGGAGDEALDGSAGGERLLGRSGGDHLRGLAGDDLLFGGAGDDELYGGAGRDALVGGSGDDLLDARDGERDYVNCGAGRDVARVDAEDRVARGCEVVGP